MFVTLGIFVAYCINFGTESMDNSGSWRIPLGITFLWGLILGIGIIFFPESPRYDFRHGRVDQAKKTMTKLYGVPANHRVIIDELAEIKEQLDAESAGKGGWHGWIEMFQGPRMPYRIFLGVTLQALQQLTGANYFFYYGTVVFNGAGISNTYVTQMILGGVNFGTTFGGLYVIEHFGRRKSLITGGIWMFVCFMVFASVGHFSLDVQNPPNTPGAGKAMVVFACLFITGECLRRSACCSAADGTRFCHDMGVCSSFLYYTQSSHTNIYRPMVWAICAELYPRYVLSILSKTDS